MPLISNHSGYLYEAGCDEAGRGCLAGPVFAAAVILPQDFHHSLLNDSKQLSEPHRIQLRKIIEKEALAFSVAQMDNEDIDKYNILWASVRTMHLALDGLNTSIDHILVDGHKFIPYKNVSHTCMIKGDARFMSIAAASILAKTYRDEYMVKLSQECPEFLWDKNKGYPTSDHRQAIQKHGVTPYHRRSFKLFPDIKPPELFERS